MHDNSTPRIRTAESGDSVFLHHFRRGVITKVARDPKTQQTTAHIQTACGEKLELTLRQAARRLT